MTQKEKEKYALKRLSESPLKIQAMQRSSPCAVSIKQEQTFEDLKNVEDFKDAATLSLPN